jgi:hypothetical protein
MILDRIGELTKNIAKLTEGNEELSEGTADYIEELIKIGKEISKSGRLSSEVTEQVSAFRETAEKLTKRDDLIKEGVIPELREVQDQLKESVKISKFAAARQRILGAPGRGAAGIAKGVLDKGVLSGVLKTGLGVAFGEAGLAVDELLGVTEKIDTFLGRKLDEREERVDEDEPIEDAADEIVEETRHVKAATERSGNQITDAVSRSTAEILEAFSGGTEEGRMPDLTAGVEGLIASSVEALSDTTTKVMAQSSDQLQEQMKGTISGLSDLGETIKKTGVTQELTEELNKVTEEIMNLEDKFEAENLKGGFDSMFTQLVELEWVLEKMHWDQEKASDKLEDTVSSRLEEMTDIAKISDERLETIEDQTDQGNFLTRAMGARLGFMGRAFGGVGRGIGGIVGRLGGLVRVFSGIGGKLVGVLGGLGKFLGPLGALAGAGAAGFGVGTLLNKAIDKAFGEKGGLGKYIAEKVHGEDAGAPSDEARTKFAKTMQAKLSPEALELMGDINAPEAAMTFRRLRKSGKIVGQDGKWVAATEATRAVPGRGAEPLRPEIGRQYAEGEAAVMPEAGGPRVPPEVATRRLREHREVQRRDAATTTMREVATERGPIRERRVGGPAGAIAEGQRAKQDDTFDISVAVISSGLLG